MEKKIEPVVLVTQQLSRDAIRGRDENFIEYNKQRRYKLIWPTNIKDIQELRMFGNNHIEANEIEEAKYIFVDIKA